MSAIPDYYVVRAIFEHSTSPRERDIARQVDNEEGSRNRKRIINGNRSMWAYYERKAEEDYKNRGY